MSGQTDPKSRPRNRWTLVLVGASLATVVVIVAISSVSPGGLLHIASPTPVPTADIVEGDCVMVRGPRDLVNVTKVPCDDERAEYRVESTDFFGEGGPCRGSDAMVSTELDGRAVPLLTYCLDEVP